jgi:hypothetical protein
MRMFSVMADQDTGRSTMRLANKVSIITGAGMGYAAARLSRARARRSQSSISTKPPAGLPRVAEYARQH